jgi:hypothetical protein
LGTSPQIEFSDNLRFFTTFPQELMTEIFFASFFLRESSKNAFKLEWPPNKKYFDKNLIFNDFPNFQTEIYGTLGEFRIFQNLHETQP